MIGRYSDEMTFDYIMNRMLESVPDTVDKREGSIIYDALSPAAAELVKCYMELDVVMDETFVDTASLQYLMLRCKERGVAIQGETAAVIEGVFTPSSVELTAGLRFNCDEVNYTITEKISAGHYKLEAETLGTVGNKYTGLLLPIQTVNGLETAQIAAVLIPAEDGDTTDTLREKYYASIDGEAFGGNVADYREKAGEQTGEHVFSFRVPLTGEIEVKAVAGDCTDTASFRHVDTPNPSYKLVKTKSKSANWV